jgi:hypothetical protein
MIDEEPDDLKAVSLLAALGVTLSLAVIRMTSPEALHWMIALEVTGR